VIPWWLQVLGYLAGLVLAFVVGWRASVSLVRQHLAALLAENARLLEANRELVAGTSKVWDNGFLAGIHLAEFQLARTAVERLEGSRAGWN